MTPDITLTVSLPADLLQAAILRAYKEALGQAGSYNSHEAFVVIKKRVVEYIESADLVPLIREAAISELRMAVGREVREQLRKLAKAVVKEEIAKGTLFPQ